MNLNSKPRQSNCVSQAQTNMYTTMIKAKKESLAKSNGICKSLNTVDHNLNTTKCKPETFI